MPESNCIQYEKPDQQCDKTFLHLGNQKKILGTCGTILSVKPLYPTPIDAKNPNFITKEVSIYNYFLEHPEFLNAIALQAIRKAKIYTIQQNNLMQPYITKTTTLRNLTDLTWPKQ